MRAVVQRVSHARVLIDGTVVGSIGNGLLVLVGIANDDTDDDCRYVAEKIVSLRIFDDADGKMNLSLHEVSGGLLLVSQFTLYGDVRRGRRPSWIAAANPEEARLIYDRFVEYAKTIAPDLKTGTFRAMSQVELVNDGPVTILVDSKKQF